jgi:hypothetical protein
VICV